MALGLKTGQSGNSDLIVIRVPCAQYFIFYIIGTVKIKSHISLKLNMYVVSNQGFCKGSIMKIISSIDKSFEELFNSYWVYGCGAGGVTLALTEKFFEWMGKQVAERISMVMLLSFILSVALYNFCGFQHDDFYKIIAIGLLAPYVGVIAFDILIALTLAALVIVLAAIAFCIWLIAFPFYKASQKPWLTVPITIGLVLVYWPYV